MKNTLTIAGLAILLLFFSITSGIMWDRFRSEKKQKNELKADYDSVKFQIDSIKKGHSDTVYLPGKIITTPAKPTKPRPTFMLGSTDPAPLTTCLNQVYTDSLIENDISIWYTISINEGCVAWVNVDYKRKGDKLITNEKIIYSKPQLIPMPPTWHATAFVTGWSDQTMSFGAGFTLPDRWGVHLQVNPFSSPRIWGGGITYVIR